MRAKLDDKQRLQHISEAIFEIESFIEGTIYDGFSANRMMQQACVRDLEIIGEASNHLTPTLKNKYNTVDWQQVKAFRNVVAHEYYKIDTKVVW